jgi:hypothetical protein
VGGGVGAPPPPPPPPPLPPGEVSPYPVIGRVVDGEPGVVFADVTPPGHPGHEHFRS